MSTDRNDFGYKATNNNNNDSQQLKSLALDVWKFVRLRDTSTFWPREFVRGKRTP